jgi:hypothetical protein
MGEHYILTMKRALPLQFASYFLHSAKIQIARVYKRRQRASPAPLKRTLKDSGSLPKRY